MRMGLAGTMRRIASGTWCQQRPGWSHNENCVASDGDITFRAGVSRLGAPISWQAREAQVADGFTEEVERAVSPQGRPCRGTERFRARVPSAVFAASIVGGGCIGPRFFGNRCL